VNDYVEVKSRIHEEKMKGKHEDHLAKLEEEEAKVDALRLTRQAYHAERLAEKANWEAEQEALEDSIRAQRKDSVRTDLGLRLDQRVRMGQLQVNVQALEKLLAERKQREESLREGLEAINKRRIEKNKQFYLQQAQEALDSGNRQGAQEALRNYHVACSCAAPGNEPLIGGPDEEPIVAPLLPTEIPFMLPVTLAVEMQRPVIQDTRVVQEPIVEEPLEAECDEFDRCAPAPPCQVPPVPPPVCDDPSASVDTSSSINVLSSNDDDEPFGLGTVGDWLEEE